MDDPRRAAEHAAARHVAAYLRAPSSVRPPLAPAREGEGALEEPGAEDAALIARERKAVDALTRALLERGTLASAEADLIVDVARGDATADDLRHYRAVTRQSRCGFE